MALKNSTPSIFADEAARQWDCDRLLNDLTAAKQKWNPQKRSNLTKTEKEHLFGLLCALGPEEIARRLHKHNNTVLEALCETIYRYVEVLTDREANSLKHWRDVTAWLSENGYKKGTFPALGRSQNEGQLQEFVELSDFLGRTSDLNDLDRIIVRGKARLVGIHGLGGVGKTYLAKRFAQKVDGEMQVLPLLSLQAAPTLENFLLQISQAPLAGDRLESHIDLLVRFLGERRCLLVVDDVEGILCGGDRAGKYQPGYENYHTLFEQILNNIHESCLLLVGRELPRTAFMLAARHDRATILPLQGLEEKDAVRLLQRERLADEESWPRFIDLYRGNPASLKIVARRIRDLHGGKVADFLKPDSIAIGDVSALLDRHFERLSLLEERLAYWVALLREPVAIATLKELALWKGSNAVFEDAIESLYQRSLVEKSQREPAYTQQPVVMKYATHRFADEIARELLDCLQAEEILGNSLLRSHRLLAAREEPGRAVQKRLIFMPVCDALANTYRRSRHLNQKLEKLAGIAAENDKDYALENLQEVLQFVRSQNPS